MNNTPQNPVSWFALNAQDLARAARFYETVFGLPLQEVPGKDPQRQMYLFTPAWEQYGIGGMLWHDPAAQPSGHGGITGVATIDFINQFKVDYAILGASGIEADGSLLDFDYKEVSVMQAMMANARHCYLAVDHSKFGRNALVRIGDVTEFHALFTDEPPSAGLCKKLDDAGVRWHLAAKEGEE